MKYLIGALVLLNFADAFITEKIVKSGVGQEGNPFLINMVGEPTFFILKVAGVVICAVILWDIHRRHHRLALISTSCFVALYTVIVSWNLSILI